MVRYNFERWFVTSGVLVDITDNDSYLKVNGESFSNRIMDLNMYFPLLERLIVYNQRSGQTPYFTRMS